MKINPFRPVGTNPYQKQLNKTEKLPATPKTDKVEISAEAKEMQKLPSIVKERELRVAELKNQVQNGNYKVDLKEVAEGIAKFYKL
ncbi:flagellar biosynthesis anti-sigma factor FlgM [Lederbergia wuyishanensis]|uniref:Negative regulator of flagellin synthesis n=1 Tax=Lederbergia wuyishanensis TaxID=1347903 RepID=A0ABU0D917_9BACI|nr:flagellar biosynthesis anti-sigma factor FlgM [Lederbergia wuyishanensis]MCJ8007586.1 flagellar biosynthesis anti-sigma factor FlgM [Lederbergia wuyishanensis]MDQ0344831.1 negative regulator of flagellin synthesis FlgM [Lederbergia wuyishanensis]